jgi:PQQ-like domain
VRRVLLAIGVLLLVGSAWRAAPAPTGGWLTFGGGDARTGIGPSLASVSNAWFTPLPGMVTTQPIVVPSMPHAGMQTLYVGTAAGFVYALAPNGYVRWRADLGRQLNACPQIPDGWGVTGTPVADPASRTLYVVDAFGRLHALDLATGHERSGWPVVLYRNYPHELDWGALSVVDGSVYVPVGSFCDQSPMQGKLLRVVVATKQVTRWISSPNAIGGGGSIWGWGGASYSTKTGSLYVGTGNTFEGGTNTGEKFNQQAGYGVQLVQLSPDLKVVASSKPSFGTFDDNGFVGAPVLADPSGCGELVAAQTKSGAFLGWRADDLGSGPVWQMQVQPSNPATPLLTEPAWSPSLRSYFVTTWTSLIRLEVGDDCKAKVVWKESLGQATLEGSPTVAGNTVWLAVSNEDSGLVAYNATTGTKLKKIPVGGISFTPPTVVGDTLYMGAVHGFSSNPFPASSTFTSTVDDYRSGSDGKHVWESRENGVYATDDGGHHSRRIYPHPAVRVVRTSATDGVIAVGSPAPKCNCSTTRLWTHDGGRTWHETKVIGPGFDGAANGLYWWNGNGVFEVDHWPPSAALRSHRVATLGGSIVDDARIPGGIAALIDRRTQAPQVVVVRSGQAKTVTLPAGGASAVPRSISVAWPTITVTGHSYASPAAGADPVVTWRSHDGGATWSN